MKRSLLVLLGVVLASLVASQVFSQQDQGQERRGRRQREGAGQNDAQPGPRMGRGMGAGMDQIKEDLGVTDEQWKALEPKIQKIRTLQSEGFAGRFGGMGNRPMRAPGGEGAPERPQSDIAKKTDELRKIIDDKNAKPESIKQALTALRQAREKNRTELTTAQKDLKSLVTMRQEAQLVLRSILE